MSRAIDLKAINRTIRVTAGDGRLAFSRHEVLFAFQKNFPSIDDKLLAVWKLEAPTAWFFTFTNEDVVSKLCDIGGFEGAQGRTYLISSCDKRKIVAKVLWLPIWATDQAIYDDLYMFCDSIDNIEHEYIDGIMTGTRFVSLTIRENDIPKFPYSVTFDRIFGLVVIPGRPPKCFKCNSIGHVRDECPNGITSVRPRRSWANVVNSGRHETQSRASSVHERGEELSGGDEVPRHGQPVVPPPRAALGGVRKVQNLFFSL